MLISDETPSGCEGDLSLRIIEAIHAGDIDARVEAGFSVIEHAMISRIERDGLPASLSPDHIDVEPEDFFDLLSIIMGLPEPAARQVGLTGLTAALDAPDFDAFQISCLAVERFCGWVGLPSMASH